MADTKDERIAEGRKHLARARKQWDDATTASWPPTDAADCVSKCFYAFENAVVAAATALGIKWKKNHGEKAKLAAALVDQGKLSTNIAELLGTLNDVRKDVSYDEPGPALADIDLEDLLGELEEYLADVSLLIDEVEEAD